MNCPGPQHITINVKMLADSRYHVEGPLVSLYVEHARRYSMMISIQNRYCVPRGGDLIKSIKCVEDDTLLFNLYYGRDFIKTGRVNELLQCTPLVCFVCTGIYIEPIEPNNSLTFQIEYIFLNAPYRVMLAEIQYFDDVYENHRLLYGVNRFVTHSEFVFPVDYERALSFYRMANDAGIKYLPCDTKQWFSTVLVFLLCMYRLSVLPPELWYCVTHWILPKTCAHPKHLQAWFTKQYQKPHKINQ